MENDGKRTVHTRNVGILLPRTTESKKVSRESWKRKASMNTGSVASGIASHGVLGSSEVLP